MKSLPPASDRAELDLHELTVEQAIEEFVRFYNGRVSLGKKDAIDVIHGNIHGDRIRRRLQAFLAEHPDKLAFEPGEKLDGNPGRTRVYPERALPNTIDLLESQILDFCQSPKTREKIVRKFRRHGYSRVAQALGNLVNDSQLNEVKNRHKEYEAARQ